MLRNRSVAMMTHGIVVNVVMPRRRCDQTLASGIRPDRSGIENRKANSNGKRAFHIQVQSKLARNRACFKVRSRRANDQHDDAKGHQ